MPWRLRRISATDKFKTEKVSIRVAHEEIRLAYIARRGQGRGVMFIHGMGSSRMAFLPLLQQFPTKHPLYALDLPGFGASSLPRERQAVGDYVAAVLGFMDALGLHRPILVGHSFGGMVAAETAILEPKRVFGVFLVASAGWTAPRNVMQPSPSVCLNRLGIWITGSDWFGKRMVNHLGMDARMLSAADRRRLRYGWRHAHEMARMGRFYESKDMAGRLQRSKVPAIVLAGSRDPLFPLDEVKRVVGDRFRLWVMEGVGHLPIDQRPEEFRELLHQALTQLESVGRLRSEDR